VLVCWRVDVEQDSDPAEHETTLKSIIPISLNKLNAALHCSYLSITRLSRN